MGYIIGGDGDIGIGDGDRKTALERSSAGSIEWHEKKAAFHHDG